METQEQQIQQLNEEYKRRLEEIQHHAAENPSAEQGTASLPEIHENEPVPLEHQAISQTTEEMIQKEIPEFQASSHTPGPKDENLSEEAKAKVEEWVAIARTDPFAAIKAAKDFVNNSGDISLIDAFHGRLTSDEQYKELIQSGKLPEVK
jgi:hypothetical protein